MSRDGGEMLHWALINDLNVQESFTGPAAPKRFILQICMERKAKERT